MSTKKFKKLSMIRKTIKKHSNMSFENIKEPKSMSFEKMKQPKSMSKEVEKMTNELACELLDVIVTEQGVVEDWAFCDNLIRRLHRTMLSEAESDDSSNDWTSTENNSIQIFWRNGKKYKFSAFKGYQFGGSEAYYEYKLTMECGDKTYRLYSYSEYSR